VIKIEAWMLYHHRALYKQGSLFDTIDTDILSLRQWSSVFTIYTDMSSHRLKSSMNDDISATTDVPSQEYFVLITRNL
jgi:hypothetical protein